MQHFVENFFTSPFARELCESEIRSVAHMDDDELRWSVLADMQITIKDLFGLHWIELFRFIKTPEQTDRVLNAIVDLIDEGLILECGDQEVTLPGDTATLQKIMDMCGIYRYDVEGIEYPDNLIGLTDEGRDAIEQIGVEGVAEMIAAEMHGPKSSTSVH